MSEVIGINKDKIAALSDKIREGWNSFFWEFRVCQWHIRFGNEERSNYVGDLLNYFDDTLHHLQAFKTQPDYLSSLYHTMAVLQMMYVEQDLMDELLNLFKLGKSNSDDKKFVRRLRNELIGHPISRGEGGNLISSVFITGMTKDATLSYIRYHRDNNYQYDLINLDWNDIFIKHEKYLEEYLNIILQKISDVLSHFAEVLIKLSKGAGKVSFEKLIRWIDQVFEIYTKNFPLFYPDNILLCYEKKDVHPRYKHALGLFQDGLGDRISEVLREVNDHHMPRKKIDMPPNIEVSIRFVSFAGEPKEVHDERIEKIGYEFGKLFERDHIFGLSYFMRRFDGDAEVISELENMSVDQGSRGLEFHCSYEYLKHIFKQRGLL